MLKIESKDFYPIEGDKDFKVRLKAPSFAEFQDIQIETNRAAPSGGPDSEESPERLKARIQKLFAVSVIEVRGCEINGQVVSTADQLFLLSPPHIINAIAREIYKMSNPTEAEIKN